MGVKDSADLLERVAVSVCEVVAEEGDGTSSCVEYYGLYCAEDWCDECKSVVNLNPILSARGLLIGAQVISVEVLKANQEGGNPC